MDYTYDDRMDEVNSFRGNPTKWINYTFEAWLTEAGRNELKRDRDRKLNNEVSKSAIDVNNSIGATNASIKQTNELMLAHAERQDDILQKQTGLVERQLTLVDRQNRLYKYTLFLTATSIALGIGVFIATINSNADKQSIATLQSRLEAKNKEIKRLQLLKSDTLHYVLHYPVLKNALKTGKDK